MILDIKHHIFVILLLMTGVTWAAPPVVVHLANQQTLQGSFSAEVTIDNEVQITGLHDLNFFDFSSRYDTPDDKQKIENLCIYSNSPGNFYTITLTGTNADPGTGTGSSLYPYQLNNDNPADPQSAAYHIWYSVALVTEGQTYNLINKAASPQLHGSSTPNCSAQGDPLASLNFKFLSGRSGGAGALLYGAYIDTLTIMVSAA